jgi:hypothetical protein
LLERVNLGDGKGDICKVRTTDHGLSFTLAPLKLKHVD